MGWRLGGPRWSGGLFKCLDNRVEALIFELMLDLGAQLLRAPYIGCWVLMRAGN